MDPRTESRRLHYQAACSYYPCTLLIGKSKTERLQMFTFVRIYFKGKIIIILIISQEGKKYKFILVCMIHEELQL